MKIEQYISHLKTVFDSSAMPVCCLGMNLDMLYVNQRFRYFFEKHEASFHSAALLEMVPFINNEWVREQLSQQQLNHTFQVQLSVQKPEAMLLSLSIEQHDDGILLFFFLTGSCLEAAGDDAYMYSNLAHELINNIPDNIFAKDRQHRFLLANKGVAGLLGLDDPVQLLGKTDFDFFPYILAKSYHDDEQRVMETGDPQFGKEEEVLDSTGTMQWYSTTKVPLRDENNEIIGVLGIGRNISRQREEKVSLQEAKREAEITDQLKSAFLANMSHELRTPLNGILGFAQFLRHEDLVADKRTKYVDIIFYNGKHLLGLINNLIDIAKIDAGEIFINEQPFALNPLMYKLNQYFNELLENKLKKGIAIHTEVSFPDVSCNMVSDQNRLYQILENLLNNAIKFTKNGDITFGYKPYNDKMLLFYVMDTGIGIPPDKQEIIFNKFRQADDSLTRQYGGVGLGLAIVKGLVEILGGELWFESVENQGSTFYFTLPYVENPGQPEDDLTLSDKWKNKTILIVEDDPMSFKYLDAIFKRQHVKVAHAKDGLQALNLFEENTYSLVIMDIRLPELNGLETTRRMKKQDPDIPVVALTAYTYDNDIEQAQKAGCDYFVSKPVDRIKLFEIMNNVL